MQVGGWGLWPMIVLGVGISFLLLLLLLHMCVFVVVVVVACMSFFGCCCCCVHVFLPCGCVLLGLCVCVV